MDTNKKEGRQENTLIRMPKKVRASLGVKKPLEISASDYSSKKAMTVKPYMAYSSDIKNVKAMIKSGDMPDGSLTKIAFVTSTTFNKLCGKKGAAYFEADICDTFKDILLGTDPELLLFKDGQVVDARKIAGMSKQSRFGSDGPMAELRPEPAYSPEDLVENMTNIFQDKEIVSKLISLDWKSICYHKDKSRDYPVGTHIHFDNPVAIRSLSGEAKHRLFAVTNKILDELLTIPMIRLDGQQGHLRRANCSWSATGGFGSGPGTGYGFFGEYRTPNGRLEHRSLSGFTIMNPELCAAVFGTAKAICEAVYKEALNSNLDPEFILPGNFDKKGIYKTGFSQWEDVPLAASFDCVKSSEFMRTVMDKSSRTEIDPKYIRKWLTRVRKLPTYGKYENYVESLGETLKASSKALDGLSKNIKKNWSVE
jgi:hypothetical protein